LSPSITISFIYSIIGIAPVIVLLIAFKSSKPKYHGLWIFGLFLIVVGAVTISIGTELLTDTEEWLSQQKKTDLIAAGKEATIHLKVWAYVFPAATIALGVNLITEFLLRRNDSVR
jgi:tellurite resistance protein TehA-like permease